MAKARARRRATTPTVPLAIAAGFLPLLSAGLTGYKGGSVHMDVASTPGIMGAMKQVGFRLSGYSPDTNRFYPGELLKGVGPIFLGWGLHMAASRFGVNRAIARAGIPIVRI